MYVIKCLLHQIVSHVLDTVSTFHCHDYVTMVTVHKALQGAALNHLHLINMVSIVTLIVYDLNFYMHKLPPLLIISYHHDYGGPSPVIYNLYQ